MNQTNSTTLNQELPLLINGSKQESNVQSSNQISGLPVVSIEKTELVSIFSTSHINSSESLFDVEIIKVSTHPLIMNAYREKNLDGLKLTMKLVGQLEPIKVVQRQEQYLIFDGVSRYLVAIELGWKTIRVEVFDFTDDEIQDQYVLRNFRTKRSMIEMCNQAELILGVLGSSQGRKRDRIGNLTSTNDDFCLAGKERFQIACEVVGCDFSASSLRRLLAVKEFEENGDEEVKGLGLMDKLEKGEMKINSAFDFMSLYNQEKLEQGTNALIEALDYAEGAHHRLFNRDCKGLIELEDESVDTAVISPPYFLQRMYPYGVIPENDVQIGADKDPDEYVKRTIELYRDVKRVLKDTGSFFINIADTYNGQSCLITYKLVTAMALDGWHLKSEWIWKKENPKPQGNSKRLLPSYEKMFHFVKNIEKSYYREFKNWKPGECFEIIKSSKDSGMGSKRSTKSYTMKKPYIRFKDFLDEQLVRNIIETTVFNWEEVKEVDPKYRHMAPFPSVLPLLPIFITSKPGDTILDIFSGTGTTAAVAVQLGRNAIGYDTDTKSHEFAAKRLRLVERNLPTENEIQEFENDYLEPAA